MAKPKDPILAHLMRRGIICFAATQDSPTRCLRSKVKAVSNYWPAVSCRKCQKLRTKEEGKVS